MWALPILFGAILALIVGRIVLKWFKKDEIWQMQESAEWDREIQKIKVGIAARNKQMIERLAGAVRRKMEKRDDTAPEDVETFITEWYDKDSEKKKPDAGDGGAMV